MCHGLHILSASLLWLPLCASMVAAADSGVPGAQNADRGLACPLQVGAQEDAAGAGSRETPPEQMPVVRAWPKQPARVLGGPLMPSSNLPSCVGPTLALQGVPVGELSFRGFSAAGVIILFCRMLL